MDLVEIPTELNCLIEEVARTKAAEHADQGQGFLIIIYNPPGILFISWQRENRIYPNHNITLNAFNNIRGCYTANMVLCFSQLVTQVWTLSLNMSSHDVDAELFQCTLVVVGIKSECISPIIFIWLFISMTTAVKGTCQYYEFSIGFGIQLFYFIC